MIVFGNFNIIARWAYLSPLRGKSCLLRNFGTHFAIMYSAHNAFISFSYYLSIKLYEKIHMWHRFFNASNMPK